MRASPDPRNPCARIALGLALLAAAGCSRVTPHVAVPDLAVHDPSFVATIEAITGAPATAQNEVTLLLNGDEIFPAQLAAIRRARQTITYAQYYYEDGPNAREIAEALAERCRHGVRGHVLLDGFGTLMMPPEYRNIMEEAGCHIAVFRPIGRVQINRTNHRNHRRILVVDGHVGFTGGSGASSKWMGNGRTAGQWRETDVRLDGRAVRYLQGAFVENWLEATGAVLGGTSYFPPLEGQGAAVAQVITSSPAGGSYAMYSMFLLAISAARKNIYITNPYFLPDASLRDALLAAAGRGVRVVALLPGEIDHSVVRQASRREFGRLLEAGIEIYEYRAGLLHSKTMVIDGVWATVGSTNFDNRSFALNEELNVAVYNRDLAQRLEQVFTEDLAHSRRVELAQWQRRGLRARILEWMALPLWPQL